MHKNFQLLKVLRIRGVSGVLPDEIENLTLLRYLEFRTFEDCELPKSMGNLRNLLTFDFSASSSGGILPNVFWKMEKLRHLYLWQSFRVPEEGFKLDTLKNLQTLWGVRGGNWMLREMLTLSPTVTKIQITQISSNEQLDAVFQCPSVISGVLQTLDLQWIYDIGFELQKLELLRRCDHLYKLSLGGRIRESLFSPVQFPSNLMKLCLQDTFLKLQETMSALGKLSNLRHLDLRYCSYMGSEWTCSAGEFPQLKHLHFGSFPNLKGWKVNAGAMPHLNYLYLSDCPKMKRLPEGLRHIITLQELEIVSMPEEFCKRLRQADNNGEIADQGGEDLHIIQHIPIVKFYE